MSERPDIGIVLQKLMWRLSVRTLALGIIIGICWWCFRVPAPAPSSPPPLDLGREAVEQYRRSELLAKWDAARPILLDLMTSDTEFVRLCDALLDHDQGRYVTASIDDTRRFFDLSALGRAADRANLKRVGDVQRLLDPFERDLASPSSEVFVILERVIVELKADRGASAVRLAEMKKLVSGAVRRGKKGDATLRKKKGPEVSLRTPGVVSDNP